MFNFVWFQDKIIEMLFKAGANPNLKITRRLPRTREVITVEPIQIYTFNANAHELIWLMFDTEGVDWDNADQDGKTLLHISADLGFTEYLEEILKKEASPKIVDNYGWTPLFYAIRGHNWEDVEMLLPISDLSFTSNLGETPLHVAVKYGKGQRPETLLKHLIENGVNIDARAAGCFSALAIACHHCDLEAVKALTQAGCDVTTPDIKGKTVLNQVTEARLVSPNKLRPEETTAEIVRLLIEAGADVEGGNPGLTPVMTAMASSQCLVVRELLGANCSTKMLPRGVVIAKDLPRNKAIYNFMKASYKGDCVDCASYLLADCCTAPKNREVQGLFYHILRQVNESLAKQGILQPPVSLARLCRVVVRASLPRGREFQRALDQLPLPRPIKDFVMLQRD